MSSQIDEDDFYAERDRRMSIREEEPRLRPRMVHQRPSIPDILSHPSLTQTLKDIPIDTTSWAGPTTNISSATASTSHVQQPRVNTLVPQIVSRGQPQQQLSRSGISK